MAVAGWDDCRGKGRDIVAADTTEGVKMQLRTSKGHMWDTYKPCKGGKCELYMSTTRPKGVVRTSWEGNETRVSKMIGFVVVVLIAMAKYIGVLWPLVHITIVAEENRHGQLSYLLRRATLVLVVFGCYF